MMQTKIQMNRGFALLEITVLLVVVGLMVIIIYKGKEVMHIARLTDEIHKLNKIQAATAMYHSKYNSFPYRIWSQGQVHVDSMIFVDLNLLTEDDLDASFLVHGHKWDFYKVNYQKDPASDILKYIYDKNSEMLVTLPVDSKLQGNQLTDKVVCYIEILLDDKGVFTGNGRVSNWSSNTVDTIHEKNLYVDCDLLGSVKSVDQYMFRVF